MNFLLVKIGQIANILLIKVGNVGKKINGKSTYLLKIIFPWQETALDADRQEEMPSLIIEG